MPLAVTSCPMRDANVSITFPDVINDDGFVRCQFHMRTNVVIFRAQKIFIKAPHNIYSLIKIKTRARLGNMQLTARQLCTCQDKKDYSNILRQKLFSKSGLSTLIYIFTALIIRLRAAHQYANLQTIAGKKTNLLEN